MSNLCTEVGYQSLVKYGEELCGDNVQVLNPDDDTTLVVLADGLGSGVKASILSTLTSKIISTMMAREMSVEACVAAVVATLPVCKVRGVAYSTFTILRITGNSRAEVIQFDNPAVILLRDGRHWEFPRTAETIEGKTIYKAEFPVHEGDTFVAISDGVEHAGVGQSLNFGWQRPDIIQFLEGLYEPQQTARTVTEVLLEQCGRLYEGRPGDDTTVCTLKIRKRMPMNLLIGPPQNPEDVNTMMGLFFGKAGGHIVCGGTTATLAGQYLGKPVNAMLPSPDCDPDIPPTAEIEGVDLVTEGVITLSRVLEYSEEYLAGRCGHYELAQQENGAAGIARLLFEEATDINFYVGRAINPAHQNPGLPIHFSIKMRLVEELVQNLEKMGKRVKASYF